MEKKKEKAKKEKKEKKSEWEYKYIKIPMYFNGQIVYNYCTPLDTNYDELWKLKREKKNLNGKK